MSKALRAIVMAITAGVAMPADAGVGGDADNLRPSEAAGEPSLPDDDGPVLPPWERPGAEEPEDGVDDDPTPFNPAEGPTAPDPD
jgi:hypothetical protein